MSSSLDFKAFKASNNKVNLVARSVVGRSKLLLLMAGRLAFVGAPGGVPPGAAMACNGGQGWYGDGVELVHRTGMPSVSVEAGAAAAGFV